MGGDDKKIIRIPGETLVIKLSPEEEAYRKKYLPDAKKLTDEKLVCTVCSVSLAQNIHKGKDLFIHRSLQVLVCEACYNFYGDGCFSADEDGDDKYCRWCGQGGTLYICYTCNCAFCQKCTKQNLKASVLADLENDDWRCYICNPRPLFGCRTICWGAQQLNNIGKEKEQERVRKMKERLEKMEAKRKEASERKSRKASSSEDESSIKKRKRDSDNDSTSPEVMPKRTRRESRNLNGSIGRRRQNSSSNSESEDDKRVTRKARRSSKKEKIVQTSSEDESDSKHKKEKLKKKKKKHSSDESSDAGKKQPKRRPVKKRDSTDAESSEDDKSKKKKKASVKKRSNSTDSSSVEREKKKKLRKKKKYTSSEGSSEESKKRSKKLSKKKDTSSSDKSSDEDESVRRKKKTKSKSDKEEVVKKQDTGDSDNDIKKGKKVDSEEVNVSTAEDILVKKRIKLAILWLSTIVKDISELGTLISLRATKFSKKKINTENLKSYEDVLNSVSKIKQLISGVHSNYDHIEKTLDSHLKPWKILTGLADADHEKTIDGENSVVVENSVSRADERTVKSQENTSENDTCHEMEVAEILEESKDDKIKEQNEENLNNWSDDSEDQNETRALISKANEALDRSQNEDKQCEENLDKTSDTPKKHNESSHEEENRIKRDVKEDSMSAKSGSDNLVHESMLETPKKTSKSINEKEESTDKSNKSKKITESESENEERSPKKNSEVKTNSNEIKEEKSEIKEDKRKELESEGNKGNKHLQNDPGLTDDRKYSTDEDSELNSFSLKLKDKWLPETCVEEMNLKQSVETDSEDKEEVPVAKIVSKKSISSESEEENEIERPKRETRKKVKKLGRTKINEEKDKAEDLSSEDEEKHSKKSAVKRKIDKAKSKEVAKEEKSKCLSSSDEKEEKVNIKIKRTSSKNKDSKKTKKDQSKCLSSSSDEEDDDKNIKSKSKSDQAKGKKKEKSKSVSSEDEEEESKKRKLKSIKKESQEKDSKKKSIGKGDTEKKTKDPTQDDGSDNDEGSKSVKKENKSKSSRKNKLKEENCDKESTQSKKSKLKKLKESKENEDSDISEDDKKGKTAKEKVKNDNQNESSTVCLTSDNESIDTAVVENGKTNGDNKEMCTDQENAEMSEVQMNNKEVDEDNNMDFQLELQASSNENTGDIKVDQENKKKSGKKQKVKDQAKAEEISDTKDEDGSKKKKSKFVGLDSSSDEETTPKKKRTPKKKPVHNQSKFRNVLVLSSDDEGEEEKLEEPVHIESSEEDENAKEKDNDYTVTVSSADSSDSEILPMSKRKKKGSSDSDASISEEEAPKKKKRKRVKCADSSDESGESGDEKTDISQKGNQGESPAKGGRKNIKKIKKKDDLEQTTIEAAEEEKERRKRIEERQKLFNQVFEVKETAKLEHLVLDFDPDSKKELISVNKDLVAKMKPHQARGVKFMWDSCFESVKQVKKTKGSGCILAHCMGLGKTFQVISLIHTLITHEELTKVRTVMVVCPLSTVLNWYNEFGKWLEGIEGGDDIEVFHLTKYNKNPDRASELRRWQHNGGVLIIGYEMFRNLTNETTKKFKARLKKDFLETLIDPGADLIVCDEGHMLKNEATALSKAMTRVKTLRRIVLTGTPMQNNLKEYHCMVQFVKPNLLGTSKEFLNRFVNPINNGQFVDSTDHDVKLMKRRAHVLHKMLEGLVQRFDYNVLTPFLPPKQEYVISVCLSELQEKLYSYYLENESQKAEGMKGGARLFMDWQSLGRVWTHPRVLKMSADKANWLKEKKALEESDSEGSLRDFIDDGSDKNTTTPDETSDESSSEGDKKKKYRSTRSTRATRQTSNVALLESSDDEKNKDEGEAVEDQNKGDWWGEFVEPQHFEDMRMSGKLLLLFSILKECELIEDKVLVFSQSLFSLDLIEYFLDKVDAATQEGRLEETLDNHQGTWSKGLDYFRLDGSTSSENRNIWCKSFNREDNPRARLFLISTRAGGLGINLTAANRVIIFDASWNPSHDIQSIFRIYRFGQKKPCYVYRFVAFGTMEEKVYERQVAKQSISNRVVDEQQVHRHFSMNDLTELYTFTPASKLEERPTPALPRDPLMAEILSQMKVWIEKYHEHDSLLENVVEEELNEEERKAAWEDFENDKKRGFMPPAGPQGQQMNPNAAWNAQIEVMRQQLKLKYADKSDEDINNILVYQVSILMRQQQQMQLAAQMKAAGNMGYRPQMYGNNMMGGQMYNQRPQMQTTAYLRNIAPKPTASQQNYNPEQVYRMQQQANLMRMQMQQMAQQQKTPHPQQQTVSGLQSMLAAQLGQTSTNYPTANLGAAFNSKAAADLQRMKQNYQAAQAARAKKPGLVITEIKDDKPSKS